jgi:hypothetical protein
MARQRATNNTGPVTAEMKVKDPKKNSVRYTGAVVGPDGKPLMNPDGTPVTMDIYYPNIVLEALGGEKEADVKFTVERA